MTLRKLLTGLTAVSGLAAVVALAVPTLQGCTVTTCKAGDPGCNIDTDSGPTDSGPATDGSSEAAPDSGPASCSAIPAKITFAPPATCDTCMQSNCCAEATACANSTGDAGSDTCMDYNDCLNPCLGLSGAAQTACIQACDSSHPNSKSIWVAMANCLDVKCGVDGGTGACP